MTWQVNVLRMGAIMIVFYTRISNMFIHLLVKSACNINFLLDQELQTKRKEYLCWHLGTSKNLQYSKHEFLFIRNATSKLKLVEENVSTQKSWHAKPIKQISFFVILSENLFTLDVSWLIISGFLWSIFRYKVWIVKISKMEIYYLHYPSQIYS